MGVYYYPWQAISLLKLCSYLLKLPCIIGVIMAAKSAPRAKKVNSGINVPAENVNNQVVIYNQPITEKVIEGVLIDDYVPNWSTPEPEKAFDFNEYRATYARTTRVFAPNVAPKTGSKTHIIFELCVEMTLEGLLTGDKTLDKKLFMSYAHSKGIDIVDTSLSAGFYQWVRSLRPMPIN